MLIIMRSNYLMIDRYQDLDLLGLLKQHHWVLTTSSRAGAQLRHSPRQRPCSNSRNPAAELTSPDLQH